MIASFLWAFVIAATWYLVGAKAYDKGRSDGREIERLNQAVERYTNRRS